MPAKMTALFEEHESHCIQKYHIYHCESRPLSPDLSTPPNMPPHMSGPVVGRSKLRVVLNCRAVIAMLIVQSAPTNACEI